jgi:hypothetical protein
VGSYNNDERQVGGIVDGLRVQAMRRAVSRPTIRADIDVWRTVGKRMACDLHKLRDDGVLRTENPDGQDHDVNLTQPSRIRRRRHLMSGRPFSASPA